MDRPAAYMELRNLLAEIHDLSHAGSLLAWDERTMMPPKGEPVRAEQLATLARVRHGRQPRTSSAACWTAWFIGAVAAP